MSRLQCGESLGCRRRHPAPCSLTHNSLLRAEGLAWGPGALHLLAILGKGFRPVLRASSAFYNSNQGRDVAGRTRCHGNKVTFSPSDDIIRNRLRIDTSFPAEEESGRDLQLLSSGKGPQFAGGSFWADFSRKAVPLTKVQALP